MTSTTLTLSGSHFLDAKRQTSTSHKIVQNPKQAHRQTTPMVGVSYEIPSLSFSPTRQSQPQYSATSHGKIPQPFPYKGTEISKFPTATTILSTTTITSTSKTKTKLQQTTELFTLRSPNCADYIFLFLHDYIFIFNFIHKQIMVIQ